jgi:hypothetical protein
VFNEINNNIINKQKKRKKNSIEVVVIKGDFVSIISYKKEYK